MLALARLVTKSSVECLLQYSALAAAHAIDVTPSQPCTPWTLPKTQEGMLPIVTKGTRNPGSTTLV